jgi:hypothetical protein
LGCDWVVIGSKKFQETKHFWQQQPDQISSFITASKQQLGLARFFFIFFHTPQRPAKIETRIEPQPLAASYHLLWTKSRGD